MSRFKEWTAPATLITLLGAVCGLGYVVVYRMPDLENEFEELKQDQREQFSDLQVEQRERFKRVDTQLLGMRTNMLRLCARHGDIEKDCQIEEIVSIASAVGSFQAQQMASARISNLKGDAPEVVSYLAESVLSDLGRFPRGQTIRDNDQIASAMVWTVAAKEASWKSVGSDLQVTFANGSAVFIADSNVSSADVAKTAAALNDLSASFRFAADAPASIENETNGASPAEEPKDQGGK